MKKVKQPKKPPQPVWRKVATRDIKYDSFTVAELLSWVKDNVPEGTKDEDIRLAVDVDETHGYYDDIIVDVDMTLSVKESHE